MNYKMDFARTLADTMNPSMSECEAYGMAFGCDEYCPVYERGDCKVECELDFHVTLEAERPTDEL
jgi:hypothetical protein